MGSTDNTATISNTVSTTTATTTATVAPAVPAATATAPADLPPRIHVNHFLVSYPKLSSVEKAGFIAFCGHKTWMREQEWLDLMLQYEERDSKDTK